VTSCWGRCRSFRTSSIRRFLHGAPLTGGAGALNLDGSQFGIHWSLNLTQTSVQPSSANLSGRVWRGEHHSSAVNTDLRDLRRRPLLEALRQFQTQLTILPSETCCATCSRAVLQMDERYRSGSSDKAMSLPEPGCLKLKIRLSQRLRRLSTGARHPEQWTALQAAAGLTAEKPAGQ